MWEMTYWRWKDESIVLGRERREQPPGQDVAWGWIKIVDSPDTAAALSRSGGRGEKGREAHISMHAKAA
jgi:hypothetical protein